MPCVQLFQRQSKRAAPGIICYDLVLFLVLALAGMKGIKGIKPNDLPFSSLLDDSAFQTHGISHAS